MEILVSGVAKVETAEGQATVILILGSDTLIATGYTFGKLT